MWYDVYNKETGNYVITIEIDQHGLEQIQRDFLLEMKAAEYVRTEVDIFTQDGREAVAWAAGD